MYNLLIDHLNGKFCTKKFLECFNGIFLLNSFFRKPTEDEEWPAYSREEPNYYVYNAVTRGIQRSLRNTACAFWSDFLPRLKGVPGRKHCLKFFIMESFF